MQLIETTFNEAHPFGAHVKSIPSNIYQSWVSGNDKITNEYDFGDIQKVFWFILPIKNQKDPKKYNHWRLLVY